MRPPRTPIDPDECIALHAPEEEGDTADPDAGEEATSGPMLDLKLVVSMRQVRWGRGCQLGL